jgi:4'-phosphopantetheinyl transferase
VHYHISHIKECEQEFGSDSLISTTQQRSLWAKKLIIKHTGLPLEIVYDSFGKPSFYNNSAIHFSISHTSDYIAIVIDNEEIGIDIEYIRKHKQAVARRFFTAEENEYLFSLPNQDFDIAFTKLWTLKEAFSKCIGTGIRGTFSTQTIDLPNLKIKGTERDFELLSFFDLKTNLFVAICKRSSVSISRSGV